MTDASPTAEPPFDVVGFGVNALDLIAVIDGYPEPDTKVQFSEFDLQGGGMTATAMVACARLGLRARYVGKVGTDLWSRLSRRLIAQEGVDVRGVIRAEGSPGHVSVVLADRGTGQRTLFFRRPAEYAIRPEELDRSIITSGRLLHVDGVDADAAMRAIDWARAAGMRITMDGERVVPGIERVWPRVDLLVCNPRFLAAVTGTPNAEAGLQALAARGPARVAVTLAERGVLGLAEGRFVHVPGFAVTSVDTNGAGDVFHGACAIGELRDWPFAWTLTVANAVAAMKCRSLGGRAGIPRLVEVIEFLAANGHGEIAAALASHSRPETN
ncbi:MAG: PfkB family carbohydrate kinase [Casimicrobiaceae bacterium]